MSLEHFIEQEILAAHAGARKEWAKKQGRDLLAIDDQREIEARARERKMHCSQQLIFPLSLLQRSRLAASNRAAG